jgi:phosphoribosyl 1,2-cyclic phosphate phosphodiesterase
MSMRITLLGTGSSVGVPRLGPVWGACDPNNAKNRRRRCALLVEQFRGNGRTSVLVDTPADLREQLLDAGVSRLDAVLYTHDHADHTHGIDDLRGVFFQTKQRVPIYADPGTRGTLERRFSYCFLQPPGSLYPAILEAHDLTVAQPLRIAGAGGPIDAIPVLHEHGDGHSLGFRFGKFAYSPDIGGIPDASLPLLRGLELWIVDALRPAPHPSHFSVSQTLNWIERLGVQRAILTHMTIDLDYETLRGELPAHVEPGYDGMVIEVD